MSAGKIKRVASISNVKKDHVKMTIGPQDKEGTWHLINCQEVYVGYLNDSVFCGEGRRIGKVERTFGEGTHSQEISVPCNECEEEMFQWSPWNNIKNKHMRWRGSKNVTNTYQEEESSSKTLQLI